jgi:hypothetical protein
MVECGNYSEPKLATSENIINKAVRRESNREDSFNIRLHAFLIMHNVTIGVPSKYAKYSYHGLKRETSNVGVTTFERNRLLAHLSLQCKKYVS